MSSEHDSSMRRRFLLLHNPNAGPRGHTLTDSVVANLERRGARVSRDPEFSHIDQARAADLSKDFDAVIAAGGDGTIRAVATILQQSALPVGIIPQGTGNVLAHEVGLPRTAEALAPVLQSGPVRTITGGTANGRPFFLMAGAGFDGEVIKRLDFESKRRFGKVAYAAPVARVLATGSMPLDCTIDGRAHTANWIIVANARHYAGSFQLARAAGITKTGFLCVLMKDAGRLGTLRQLVSLGLGRLERAANVEMVAARHVVIRSGKPVAGEVDGDQAGTTPLELVWGGPQLKLIVPETFRAEP